MTRGNWEQLRDAVGVGELSMERGTARRGAEGCDALIARLKAIQDQSKWLARIDGFGPLPSGVALQRKFALKASGGEYSMDRAIGDHIAEAERMREVFLAIESRYAAAEDAHADAVRSVGRQSG